MTTIYEAAEQHGREARGELLELEIPEWSTPDHKALVYHYEGLDVEEWCAITPFLRVVGDQVMLTPEGVFVAARWTLRDEKGARLFGTDAQFERMKKKYSPVVLISAVNRSNVLDAILAGMPDQAKKT